MRVVRGQGLQVRVVVWVRMRVRREFHIRDCDKSETCVFFRSLSSRTGEEKGGDGLEGHSVADKHAEAALG